MTVKFVKLKIIVIIMRIAITVITARRRIDTSCDMVITASIVSNGSRDHNSPLSLISNPVFNIRRGRGGD